MVAVGPNVPIDANFGVRITGNSMEPQIYDGDIVWVKQQQILEEGQIGVFVLNNEGYCKKYHTNRLESLNPKYADILFDLPKTTYFKEGLFLWPERKKEPMAGTKPRY